MSLLLLNKIQTNLHVFTFEAKQHISICTLFNLKMIWKKWTSQSTAGLNTEAL